MQNRTRLSQGHRPFRLNALAGALALTFLGGVAGEAHAVPLAPLGASFKLNTSPPELILLDSPDVDLNNLGAGVALWQRHNEDGRYATYFKRFDRFGNVSALQTHELAAVLNPARLLKVFDNGEFAIESRQGSVLKITIRDRNGAVARNLRDIQCRTATDCRAVMDDQGDVIVGDKATVSGRSHPVVQLLNAAGTVVRPWFVVDQPVNGVTSTGRAIVAADADGDFAVGWQAYPQVGYDRPIFLRLYQKTGVARTEQFRAHPTSASIPTYASIDDVAMDADGDFVMTWERYADNDGFVQREFGVSFYRKDGMLLFETLNDGAFPSYHPHIRKKVVIDDDGDYAIFTNASFGYATYGWGHLDVHLYSGTTNTRARRLLEYDGEYLNPTVSGDLAMDGKGHLAALWLYHTNPDAPPGLFLQRFTGPLGEGCGGAGATLVGTDIANTINGTAGDDIIHGKGGNDVIHGNGGNDVICGGAGLDRLYGDAGFDRLLGDGGADQLFGGDGNDYLYGGPDLDSADGGPGTDTCIAESNRNCP